MSLREMPPSATALGHLQTLTPTCAKGALMRGHQLPQRLRKVWPQVDAAGRSCGVPLLVRSRLELLRALVYSPSSPAFVLRFAACHCIRQVMMCGAPSCRGARQAGTAHPYLPGRQARAVGAGPAPPPAHGRDSRPRRRCRGCGHGQAAASAVRQGAVPAARLDGGRREGRHHAAGQLARRSDHAAVVRWAKSRGVSNELGGCNGRMVVSVELWVVCCISDVLYGHYRSRPHRQSRSPSQKRHNHKSNLLELWASTTWACNGRTAISVELWVYAVTMTCGIRFRHACSAVGTNWSRHKRV